MRTLPHSVVVVTSTKPRFDAHILPEPVYNPPLQPTHPRDYRGITVSSFTTITLEPEPIISFNVKYPSETLSAIEQSRQFLVHVLEASEGGMSIADAFTKGRKHAKDFLRGNKEGAEVTEVEVITKYEGQMMSFPMLKAEGVMRVLRCTVMMKTVMVGDHRVVFARVDEILGGEEWGLEGKTGLCYADGRYRRVGDIIEVKKDIVEEKKYVKEYCRPTLAHFIQSRPDHPLSGHRSSKGL
jgi:flavin reductase (DIM6/NTAB) family NADH-FMN oxidoreductase RutF